MSIDVIWVRASSKYTLFKKFLMKVLTAAASIHRMRTSSDDRPVEEVLSPLRLVA